MNEPRKHFQKTKKLILAVKKSVIGHWLLNEGYYPEKYVLPPNFRVTEFRLRSIPYNKDLRKLGRQALETHSYPKSELTLRVFAIQHPHNYHDIVLELLRDWKRVIDHIFNDKIRIYSYSFPIPVTSKRKGKLGKLRAGRMIYEWIAMAEKDIISESHGYKFLVKTDISNFYNSIYTHSIAWAIEGEAAAFRDKTTCKTTGNKIDKLVQYANQGRTNGIPIGSALSDLIAEIILASVDKDVSEKLLKIEFLGVRFKDDYRILCKTKEDAQQILKVLTSSLLKFNLLLNERKTEIFELPNGLFRPHAVEYFKFGLPKKGYISLKSFEYTFSIILEIHKSFSNTSIINKFLSELVSKDFQLRIKISLKAKLRLKQLERIVSLLLMMKRESIKSFGQILALIDLTYEMANDKVEYKKYLKTILAIELELAINNNSDFEVAWLIYYSKFRSLGLTIKRGYMYNNFVKSIDQSDQHIFRSSAINLFTKTKHLPKDSLVKILAVFEKDK